MSGNRALELPSCRRRWREMKGERERKEGRERQKENAPHDFFFIAAAPLVARRSRFTSEVGRLSRSWVSPPGFGGRGPVRAAVINNAAINPGLSPAGMTAFGKKRRESSSPPHLYPPASFPRYPFRSSFSLSFSISIYPALSMREREGWL